MRCQQAQEGLEGVPDGRALLQQSMYPSIESKLLLQMNLSRSKHLSIRNVAYRQQFTVVDLHHMVVELGHIALAHARPTAKVQSGECGKLIGLLSRGRQQLQAEPLHHEEASNQSREGRQQLLLQMQLLLLGQARLRKQ